MIQEVYNISRDTMSSLLDQLRSPSREQVLKREALIKRLQAEIPTVISGDSEIDHFEDLDLSFLKDTPFSYSELAIPEDHSSVHIAVNQPICNESETSYKNEIMIVTAA